MFAEQAVVEGQDGVARLGPEGLDRVGVAARKVPGVAGREVDDLHLPGGIDHRRLAVAGDDVAPLGGGVPVHLAHPTRIQEDVGPRDPGGEGQLVGGDLPRPAARGRLDRAAVEGGREHRGRPRLAGDRAQEGGIRGDVGPRRMTVPRRAGLERAALRRQRPAGGQAAARREGAEKQAAVGLVHGAPHGRGRRRNDPSPTGGSARGRG